MEVKRKTQGKKDRFEGEGDKVERQRQERGTMRDKERVGGQRERGRDRWWGENER